MLAFMIVALWQPLRLSIIFTWFTQYPLSPHTAPFGTLAEWVECPAGIAAQIMGHKPSATAEKHYRVRSLDLLRKWHTKIEAWILDQAGIELPVQTGLREVKSVAV